jgi:hypothetical protein
MQPRGTAEIPGAVTYGGLVVSVGVFALLTLVARPA